MLYGRKKVSIGEPYFLNLCTRTFEPSLARSQTKRPLSKPEFNPARNLGHFILLNLPILE